jgi:hypothetical protein
LLLALPAQAQCPSQDARVVLERFVPADCAACWRDAPAPAGAPAVLDWIVPSPRGDEAPLSAAALAEATARAGAPAADATLQRRHFLKPQRRLRVGVLDGPAWNGYIGLQLRVQQRDAALPRGAVAYLALVENVDAGDEGTPVARRLVRALVGPLPLDAASPANEHLRAVRLPMGVRLDRLGSVGWVENASGQMLSWATATSEDCTR